MTYIWYLYVVIAVAAFIICAVYAWRDPDFKDVPRLQLVILAAFAGVLWPLSVIAWAIDRWVKV